MRNIFFFYISLGTALPVQPLSALPLAAAVALTGKWISIHWKGF
jgi:hypothetical protein